MRICWHSIYSPKLLYLGCTLKFVYCIYKLWVMIAWWLRGKFVNLGLISSFRFSLCLIISFVNECLIFNSPAIESIRSRGQHPCKFMGTKEIFCIRKESNSHRIRLVHQHGCCFIILEHQYERRDVMWKRSIFMAGRMTRTFTLRKLWQFFPRVPGTETTSPWMFVYLGTFLLVY